MRSIGLSKHFFAKDSLLLYLGILFLFVAGHLHQQTIKPQIQISKQDTALNLNKNLLVFISAGNKRLFSDLIWVQTLLESDLEHYQKNDLNNWLFLRFISIQTLDPHFYENYLYGGQFLAIVKDDLEGANVLYEKGIEIFPNDYKLNFHAGFMNYFEKGDFETALKYLSKISNHPDAPPFLTSVVNKIKYGLSHDLEATYKLVLFNYETTKDAHIKERLGKDLYVIRSEIDLDCLNKNLKDCNTKDLNNVPYIKKADGYHAAITTIKYGIKLRKSVKQNPIKNQNKQQLP